MPAYSLIVMCFVSTSCSESDESKRDKCEKLTHSLTHSLTYTCYQTCAHIHRYPGSIDYFNTTPYRLSYHRCGGGASTLRASELFDDVWSDCNGRVCRPPMD